LALAIFLGLAAVGAENAVFGFIMLDDPSQSLGSDHKRQLVKVLNDMLSCKRLVVATMDRELRGLLAEGLTRAKTEYSYSPWTQEKGPTFTRR
jgi:DNA repair exonuclease SbcCD ATPase subunit